MSGEKRHQREAGAAEAEVAVEELQEKKQKPQTRPEDLETIQKPLVSNEKNTSGRKGVVQPTLAMIKEQFTAFCKFLLTWLGPLVYRDGVTPP